VFVAASAALAYRFLLDARSAASRARPMDSSIGAPPQDDAPWDAGRRFQALVQRSHDLLLVVNREGRIQFASPSVERILGFPPQDMIGKDIVEFAHPDDRSTARTELDRVLTPGDPGMAIEVRVTRADGSYLDLEALSSNLLDEPSVNGVVITARDVTDRKRAEHRLAGHAREMEALYDTSLEISSQPGLRDLLQAIVRRAARLLGARMGGLYLVNPDGASLHLAVSHNLPGHPLGTVLRIGEGLSGRVAQMGKPMMVEDYSKWIGRAQVYEGLAFRRVLGVPLKRGGRVIGVIDITDDKHAGVFSEDEIRLVCLFADQAAIAIENARLLEETQRRAAYLEAITSLASALRSVQTRDEMPSLLLGRLMEQTRSSAAALTLWHPETRQIVLALTYGVWEESPPPNISRPSDPVGGAVLNGQTLVTEDACAFLGMADAEWAPEVQALIVAPLVSESQVIGLVAVGRQPPFSPDEVRLVSAVAEMAGNALYRAGVMETLELRVAERTRELAEANLRLQELDRLKSDFVSNVSHELRTPITNILLYLELLGSTEAGERRHSYLSTLRREAERLSRLIEDLLTLSRIERGALPMDRQQLALDPILSEVVAAHLAKATSKQISLTYDACPDLPEVVVNRERIAQVLNNLLANALAYCHPGGIVRMSTSLDEVGDSHFVGIAIFNNGPAIHPEDLPHIFQRFYRGRQARESGEHGTGLGLAISKEIVEFHHGWIDVESSEAAGTRFTVWLPVSGPLPN
jgi:PAS domain S-box-containing protein